jgi:hypothetical protein
MILSPAGRFQHTLRTCASGLPGCWWSGVRPSNPHRHRSWHPPPPNFLPARNSPAGITPADSQVIPVTQTPPPVDALCPGVREPISVEDAVLHRDMSVLKREAADALAALGAAHALITSARLAQVQQLRPEVESGGVTPEALMALAADYQGWQNDQVRLFDALSLIMRMRVPQGLVLDQMDPALHGQARSHLEALSLEYSRRQLMDRFQASK